jgi:hypothetical protein
MARVSKTGRKRNDYKPPTPVGHVHGNGPGLEKRMEAKRRYENGENISAIGRALELRRATIHYWIKHYGWVSNPEVELTGHQTKTAKERATDRAFAEVVDIATRQVVETVQSSHPGAVQAQADLIADCLLEHGGIAQKMLKCASKMMDDLLANRIIPGEKQSVADVFNSVISGVTRAVASSRDIAGLRSGQVSTGKGFDIDQAIVIEQRRLETIQIKVDERGRKIEDAA